MPEKLDSSNLDTADYHEDSQTLTIKFKSGQEWEYYDCPERIYKGLLGAESAGKYFNANIKGKFRCQKI